ncbi:MAG: Fic family protein [Candidatus Riflebacteria bacterium]|nr:Fic family protein [Candidatus Riflebacteria bacterium]
MKPPYEITAEILSLYGQIKELLGQCKSLLFVRPEARLRKQNRIRTIHSSLAIEGNTLGIDQITAIVDNSRVVGPKKDILEVKNAIEAYDKLSIFDSCSLPDFLLAHKTLLNGLVKNPGTFRKKQVGVLHGTEVKHVAPPHRVIPGLMNNLFDYVLNDKDLTIIKGCVFHYEIEFIHPFEDGNGRMGRLWHTRLLMDENPIFEFIPIEDSIRKNQQEYYQTLAISDKAGNSTAFIEFMLGIIQTTLQETVTETRLPSIDFEKRSENALSNLKDWFDRKDYMKLNKGISTATASRDLKHLLEAGRLESSGEGRMTRYRKKE